MFFKLTLRRNFGKFSDLDDRRPASRAGLAESNNKAPCLMSNMPQIDTDDPVEFWETIYGRGSPTSSGRPSRAITTYTGDLAPGKALELGCAKGDDAVWLAKQGWQVTAIDISATALGYAAANADQNDVAGRIDFQQHDLARSFPEGSFNLVSALFLESPIGFPRAEVLRRAAAAVAPGGHLLIVEHASSAPWSWGGPDAQYPTVEATFASMALKEDEWDAIHVAAVERIANGPRGQSANVKDNILFLHRHR